VGRGAVEERRDLRRLGEVGTREVRRSARARDLRTGRLGARFIAAVMDDDGRAGLREPERDRRTDAP